MKKRHRNKRRFVSIKKWFNPYGTKMWVVHKYGTVVEVIEEYHGQRRIRWQ